jgi:hypothetical protein
VAIASLNRGKVFPEPGKVFAFARAGEIGEDVIDAEEKATLGKVHEQSNKIVAALLKVSVLALGDVVDPDVNLRSARHAAGELFAQEKIGQAAQFFGAFNRIVVGESEKIHAATLQQLIDLDWIAITFAAKLGKERGGASTGEV